MTHASSKIAATLLAAGLLVSTVTSQAAMAASPTPPAGDVPIQLTKAAQENPALGQEQINKFRSLSVEQQSEIRRVLNEKKLFSRGLAEAKSPSYLKEVSPNIQYRETAPSSRALAALSNAAPAAAGPHRQPVARAARTGVYAKNYVASWDIFGLTITNVRLDMTYNYTSGKGVTKIQSCQSAHYNIMPLRVMEGKTSTVLDRGYAKCQANWTLSMILKGLTTDRSVYQGFQVDRNNNINWRALRDI